MMGDDDSTSDLYFEETLQLQYPTSFSTLNKFPVYPSVTQFHNNELKSYDSLPIIVKVSCSPNLSPRSDGTGSTSNCTSADDDLDSYCGSLAYSVESCEIGHMLGDLDVHANREHDTQERIDDCLRGLTWIISMMQQSFNKIKSAQDDDESDVGNGIINYHH